MNDNDALRALEKEWQEYVDKHDGGYSHVEGVKKCLSELRAALTAAHQQEAGAPEPWYGHHFVKGRDGRWRCLDGCGPVLVEEAHQHDQQEADRG